MPANGPVWATSTLPLQGTALLEEMNPYVMEQTPAVLSIGRRCMKDGYSFHWPASTSPYFITPEGKRIVCEVHAFVPYMNHREPAWAGRAAAATAVSGPTNGQPAKKVRFAEVPADVGGGNAPATPGPTEPSAVTSRPGASPPDAAVDEDVPDDGSKGFPNTPEEAKTIQHLLTHLPKNTHCEA